MTMIWTSLVVAKVRSAPLQTHFMVDAVRLASEVEVGWRGWGAGVGCPKANKESKVTWHFWLES